MRLSVFFFGMMAVYGSTPLLSAADLLHVRHEGGWNVGTLMEFRSDDSGNFELLRRLNPESDKAKAIFQTRIGKIKVSDLEGLIERIKQAPQGPAANDVGNAVFEWQDHGQKQSRIFLFPARPPCAELLAAVDRLAVSAGKRHP